MQPGEFRRGTPSESDGRPIPKPKHRSDTPYVHLKFDRLECEKFIIDTSANMSIIKESMLKGKFFKRHELLRITNINNESVKAKYSVGLKINNKLCTFQVVDDNMGFPGSRILGMNFLSELGFAGDFEKGIIRIGPKILPVVKSVETDKELTFVNFVEGFAIVTHLKNG